MPHSRGSSATRCDRHPPIHGWSPSSIGIEDMVALILCLPLVSGRVIASMPGLGEVENS
jgi:hypothetical protein